MRKTKLLAATAMLLLTPYSLKVVTNIIRTYPDIILADSVYIIGPREKVSNTAETIGRVSVVDQGAPTNYRYDQVLHLAQEATGKIDGNEFAITNHQKPSFWGSSCHQISGLTLRLPDKSVDTLKTNPIQNVIDLDLVIAKDYAESRKASANTFEASFGYEWAISKIYDINDRALDSKEGVGWKLAYEHIWNDGMGIRLQYAGLRKSLSGGDVTFSYIAPEWISHTKFDRQISRSDVGVGVFLYHDSLYNAAGFGLHATLGSEYMLSFNWGLGLILSRIGRNIPKQDQMLLKEDERCGITHFNLLGGLRYYF